MKSITLLCCIFLVTGIAKPQSLEEFIDSFCRDNKFSGTILLREHNQELYFKSFGYSNISFHVDNKNDTRYKIASITKLFTSVLIMKLYEQNRIDLDKPISDYLHDYKGSGGNRITVRHLLTHTSGLPYTGPRSKEEALEKGMEELQLPHTIDEIILKYYSMDPENEPGKAFNYSNGEYIMLGRIIENLYGKSFDKVLKAELIDPLKMINSGLLFQYQLIDNLADSYFTMNDSIGLVHDLPVYIQNWYSAGAMYSTASDLAKFSDALYEGKLLKPESLAMLLTPGLDEYGFGLWIYDQEVEGNKIKVYKRPGDIMGTRSMLVYLPNKEVSIILLSNTDLTDLDDFVRQIINHL